MVGSGATGSIAAQTLLERGRRVLMLDGGLRDDRYEGLIPDQSFVEIRKTSSEQHRFFLGDAFEGVAEPGISSGAQLTPPRQVVTRDVERLLPVHSRTFHAIESLAFGGLGSAWGLGCCVFSAHELRAAGLDEARMRDAYRIVAARIGISGTDDDARPYTWDGLDRIQPAPLLDPTMSQLLRTYERRRLRLRRDGFFFGRPALALLTEPFDGRAPTRMREMEFYDDRERAAWRPWITVQRLQRDPSFRYVGNTLVTAFTERDGAVDVEVMDLDTFDRRTFTARRLVLASGVFGTARIVLRSLAPRNDRKLPLLCNSYEYLPSLVPSRIGKAEPARGNALGQLLLAHDPDGNNRDVAIGAFYRVRSLLASRLAAQIPLAIADSLPLLQYLQSGLIVVGIHQPDAYAPGKYLQRVADASAPSGDALFIEYALDGERTAALRRRTHLFARAIRMLGAFPLRRVEPGHGSSIHYAGTLPYSTAERPFALSPGGRLYGTASVYVADGSGFTYLPAKSLTLSLMANAHTVATNVP